MYVLPEVYVTHSCLVDVNQEDVEYWWKPVKIFSGINPGITRRSLRNSWGVGCIVPNHRVPQNREESLALFIEITDHLKRLRFWHGRPPNSTHCQE